MSAGNFAGTFSIAAKKFPGAVVMQIEHGRFSSNAMYVQNGTGRIALMSGARSMAPEELPAACRLLQPGWAGISAVVILAKSAAAGKSTAVGDTKTASAGVTNAVGPFMRAAAALSMEQEACERPREGFLVKVEDSPDVSRIRSACCVRF